MAARFYHERRRGFAVQICSLCFEKNLHDEELMRVYCRDHVHHRGSTAAVLVTWSPEKYLLVQIRPFPTTPLTYGKYIKCAGGDLCRRSQCTYAHSDEELLVWNTLLEEKRQHGDSGYKPQAPRPAWYAASARPSASAPKYGLRPVMQLQSKAIPVNRPSSGPVHVSDMFACTTMFTCCIFVFTG